MFNNTALLNTNFWPDAFFSWDVKKPGTNVLNYSEMPLRIPLQMPNRKPLNLAKI